MRRPLVLVPACTKDIGAHSYHVVQYKYIDALISAANCAPLLLPACGDQTDWDVVLAVADGIMLTGSPSNVHPRHFNQQIHQPELSQDEARDATTLPLIRAVIERGIPLLAICRGMQEVNVALGGSLHQAVHQLPDMRDHREIKGTALEEQYQLAHRVALTSAGRLEKLLDGAQQIMVNSLHGQGIARLAPGLIIEGRADDGLIEAYSGADIPGYLLGLQWHPEWHATENSDSVKIFFSFAQACRDYQLKKEGK